MVSKADDDDGDKKMREMPAAVSDRNSAKELLGEMWSRLAHRIHAPLQFRLLLGQPTRPCSNAIAPIKRIFESSGNRA
jgi:hypothetical protein